MLAPGSRVVEGMHSALIETARSLELMGGTVTIVVAHERQQSPEATNDVAATLQRIKRWAARLTRFDERSELSQLNRQPSAPSYAVGPTLGAVLHSADRLRGQTDGVVDVGMLDARLAAERRDASVQTGSGGRWWLRRTCQGAIVHREGHVRFDLDGVAKGWLADRALRLLADYPAALVDADGDIAVRDSVGRGWSIGIVDPGDPDRDLASVSLDAAVGAGATGIATSGTTRHRWAAERHHIIDPATKQPSQGEVIQATVIATSALIAEGLAKVAIVRDAAVLKAAIEPAIAVIMRMKDGTTHVTPSAEDWLER